MMISKLKNKILAGELITKAEALSLVNVDLEELTQAANEIRQRMCGNTFDICTIINGKSGRCSENCKYCAQASCYGSHAEEYPLLSADIMVEQAKYNQERGVLRFSIVTSGRALSDAEVDKVCDTVRRIREEVGIEVCISGGLMNQNQFERLHQAGASRVHNNLETSENYFPSVCTTHIYEDKKNAIRAAKAAGMDVCSGGIIGLGESMEDRIDLALTVREMHVHSMPVNVLCPIPGTPYENNPVLTEEEVCRTLAIFRFINPTAAIRMAGGRGTMNDQGRMCFQSGANAAISGDMLTTSGYTIAKDMKMLEELGFQAGLLE